MKILKMTLLTMAASNLLATAAFAEGGTTSGGGASVCVVDENNHKRIEQEHCDRFLDTYLRESEGITHLKAYREIVGPRLAELEKLLPDFGRELREAVEEKDWYISDVKVKVPELGKNVNGTDIPVKQRAVNYHDQGEIWIDKTWFNSRPLQEQADLIFHELLVSIRLKSLEAKKKFGSELTPATRDEVAFRYFSSSPTMDHVRKGVSLIGRKELPPVEKLQSRITDLFIGKYMNGEQKNKFLEDKYRLLSRMHDACQQPDDETKEFTPRLEAMGKVFWEIRKNADSSELFDPQLKKKRNYAVEALYDAQLLFTRDVSHGDENAYLGFSGEGNSWRPALELETQEHNGKIYLIRDTRMHSCKVQSDGYACTYSGPPTPSADRTCSYVRKAIKETFVELYTRGIVPTVQGSESRENINNAK